MITARPGSHMYNLLSLLSISGEFPSRSLGILGDERTVKAMVHRMEAVQAFRILSDDTNLKTKLFQISGRGRGRNIRLCRSALELLNDVHPKALDYYLEMHPDNTFTGNLNRIDRNHRIGEATAACMVAGIEVMPYKLPKLQKESMRRVIPEYPCFYVSREFKRIMDSEYNKTKFTRAVGLLFYPGGSYAVYNTRDALMKWSGIGELKARLDMSEIVRMNAGPYDLQSALLFGANAHIALRTMIESNERYKKETRFDRVYQSVHFVPLDRNGIDLLKILTLPDRNEKLLRAAFTPEMRPKGHGAFEYDAFWDNTYFLSHLDSDVARLIRFKEALDFFKIDSAEVVCFPWQTEFLKSYLGDSVRLRPYEMPGLLNALGIN